MVKKTRVVKTSLPEPETETIVTPPPPPPEPKKTVKQWFKEAPLAVPAPTQRYYGEEFYPKYVKWLEEGEELIG